MSAGGNQAIPVDDSPGRLGTSHSQWRLTMAIETERWDRLAIAQARPRGRAMAKPARHEDFYLCVALVVLLAWALAVGLGVLK